MSCLKEFQCSVNWQLLTLQVPQQQENQSQQGNVAAKQRPQTLDSLFANMKEQRMRALSRQKNSNLQRNGGSRPRVPWARARFSN